MSCTGIQVEVTAICYSIDFVLAFRLSVRYVCDKAMQSRQRNCDDPERAAVLMITFNEQWSLPRPTLSRRSFRSTSI